MIDHNDIPSSPTEVIPTHSDSWSSPGVTPALIVNILGGLMYGIAIGTVPIMLQFNAYLGECSRYNGNDACDDLTFAGCKWVVDFSFGNASASNNGSGNLAPYCGFPDYASVNCSAFPTQTSCAGSYPGRDGTTCVWRYHDQKCEHFVGWSPTQQGILAGMQIVGSMIAAATSGALLSKFGRRRALMWTGAIALVACTCLTAGWANGEMLPLLVLAELFLGVACGWACVVCPMYNEELVKGMKLSQTIGVLFQVSVTVGIFLVASIGFALDPKNDTSAPHAHLQSRLHYVFAMQWLTGMLAIPVGYFVPESPVWLKDRKGKITEGCLCCEPEYGDGPGSESKRLMDDDDNQSVASSSRGSQHQQQQQQHHHHHHADTTTTAVTPPAPAQSQSSSVAGTPASIRSHGGVDDIRRYFAPNGKTESDLSAEGQQQDPYAAALARAAQLEEEQKKIRSSFPSEPEPVPEKPKQKYGSTEERSTAAVNKSCPDSPCRPEDTTSPLDDTDTKTAVDSYYAYEDEDYDKDAKEGTMMDLFRTKKYLLPLAVAVALACAQQLTGVNSIFVYAPILAGRLGLPPLAGNFFISLWNFATCLTAIPVANHFPARRIFIVMCGLSAGACTLTAIAVYPGIFDEKGSKHKILGSLGIALYVWVFEIGLGPCFYVLVCNIFPPRVRAAGASFAVLVNFVCNLIINFGYAPISTAISGGPSGDQNFGMAVCCFFFAAVGLVVAVFLGWKMPKTDAEIAHDIAHQETLHAASFSE